MERQAHRVLVVTHTAATARSLADWLAGGPHELVLVTRFAAAKAQLADPPDLLITEVKLGEYNGLHLALRAHAAGIPVIVLGPPDDGFEREAEQVGATYLAPIDLNAGHVHALIDALGTENSLSTDSHHSLSTDSHWSWTGSID